jgi:type II secretion system protein J
MNRQRGFTLIEVLVGLVLLSAFVGGIYTIAIGTLQAKKKIEQTASIYTAGTEILDIIERDLRSTYFHGVRDMKALKAEMKSVRGEEATTIDLVTTVNSKNLVEINDEFVRSDITEVGYRLKENDDLDGMQELYRREQMFFDDEPLKGGKYYLVYDRVISLRIEFFEQPEEGESSDSSSSTEEEGETEWDTEEKKALPRSAKITLVLGVPPELAANPAQDDRRYNFIRWVMFPTAYDYVPKQNDQGPGGPGGPNNPR